MSLGAEKNFREFMLRLAQRGTVLTDVDYFQRLVAKAILFRSSERAVSAQRFGGYRANIVTYTIAKLVHSTTHRLDLDRIWKSQQLTPATVDAVTELSHMTHQVIVNPSGRVRHIGEWCKKLDCWKRVEELAWQPSPLLESELIRLSGGQRAGVPGTPDIGLRALSPDEEEAVAFTGNVAPDVWFRLSNWAKETGNLKPWQRGLAYSLSGRAAQGSPPTVKQALHAQLMLAEAAHLGFR